MLLRTGLFSCFLTAISGKGQALGGKCHPGVSEQGSSPGVTQQWGPVQTPGLSLVSVCSLATGRGYGGASYWHIIMSTES